MTICTKSSAGWNDCFVANDEAVSPGVLVDAYLGSDGYLEVWLTDQQANLAAPIRLIGSLNRHEDLAERSEIAIRIHVDTAEVLNEQTLEAKNSVEVIEELAIEDLPAREQDWEALSLSSATEPVTTGDE